MLQYMVTSRKTHPPLRLYLGCGIRTLAEFFAACKVGADGASEEAVPFQLHYHASGT